MVYIKHLYLKNFKSFKEAKFDFDKGINVIIGPNGSGKSNIVDAILFIFLREKSRGLRAKNIKELIFFGEKKGSVEIILSNKVSLKRVIHSYGRSEFYINDKKVSQSEYENLINEIIPKNVPNIIPQGKFEKILFSSPKEKYEILCSIIGIDYLNKKEGDIKNKIRNIREKIKLYRYIIEKDKKLLIKKKEEYELLKKYREVEEKYKELKKKIEYIEIMEYKKRLNEIEDEINNLNNRKKLLLERLNEINSIKYQNINSSKLEKYINNIKIKIEKTKLELEYIHLDKIKKEIKKLHEEKKNKHKLLLIKTKELEDLELKLKEIEDKINSLPNYNITNIKDIKNEIEELEEKIRFLNEMKEKKDYYLNLIDNLKNIEKDLIEKKENLKKIEREIHNLKKNISEKENKLKEIDFKLIELRKKLINKESYLDLGVYSKYIAFSEILNHRIYENINKIDKIGYLKDKINLKLKFGKDFEDNYIVIDKENGLIYYNFGLIEKIIHIEKIENEYRLNLKIYDELQKELKNLNDSLNYLYDKYYTLKNEIINKEKEVEKINLEIKKIELKFGKNINQDLDKILEELKLRKEKLMKEYDNLLELYNKSLEINNIKNKLYEEKLNLVKKIEKLKKEIDLIDIENINKKIKNLCEELIDKYRKKKIIERSFNELYEKYKTLSKILEKVKKIENEYRNKKEKNEKEKIKILGEIKLIDQEIKYLLNEREKLKNRIKDVDDIKIENADKEILLMQLNELENWLKENKKNLNYRSELEYKLLLERYKKELENYKKIIKEFRFSIKLYKLLIKEKEKLIELIKSKINEKFREYLLFLNSNLDGRIEISKNELNFLIFKNNKRIDLNMLSGGEKTVVVLSFILAILLLNKSNISFIILDEIDSPLDQIISQKFAKLLKKIGKDYQIILITHNEIVMKEGEIVYGLKMENNKTNIYRINI